MVTGRCRRRVNKEVVINEKKKRTRSGRGELKRKLRSKGDTKVEREKEVRDIISTNRSYGKNGIGPRLVARFVMGRCRRRVGEEVVINEKN